jgi:hypothetical protein
MSTLDDALAFVKKDPIAGFIAIPIIGARAPRPQIVVKLKGRSLVLPDWTGEEWAWYGTLAIKYSDSMDKTRAGFKDVRAANERFTPLFTAMRALGSAKPDPNQAAAYYDRAVRLVIAAHNSGDPESGTTFVNAFKEAIPNAPRVIGESLAAALSVGGDVLKPVIKSALDIMSEVFEIAVGTGIGLILLIGVGLYLWSQSQKGGNHGEA